MPKSPLFPKSDSGATAIEYALIAGSIAVVIAAVIGLLGEKLQLSYQAVLNMFS